MRRLAAARLHRLPAMRVAILGLFGLTLGLVWPLPGVDSGAATAPTGPGSTPADLPADAFEGLLATTRWGRIPAAPTSEEVTLAEEDGLNPELAKLGYVGNTEVGDDIAVLLQAPDGRVTRYLPGEAIPDGRILVEADDNAVTLESTGGEHEVLVLFPRLSGTGSTATTTPP
ncbi:MAG: hypothetical protein J4F45_12775 [Pseudomonadales bacterium]|nr:hypothetical protein [Pseudomonadales bacterium]